MRTSRVPSAALLLVLVSILQVSTAGDLYWEGEEEAANEFLEVKKDDSRLNDHSHRVKRAWPWDLFNRETSTEPDESHKDEDVDVGSGSVDRSDPDVGEKTLRVTFTAHEPYRNSYSDRDSAEFRNLSKSLANAVDQLYETKVPGTQKTSLVRIQSLINDEFSCKVTLDIVTTGFDDTDKIENILRNYIKTFSRLGTTTVNEEGFSAELIDPASPTFCEDYQFKCDDRCLSNTAKCNGQLDCSDGTDEHNCPYNQPPEPSTYNPNVNAIGSEVPDFDQRTDDIDQHNDADVNVDIDESPEVIYRNEPSFYTSAPENEPSRGDGGRASDAPPEDTNDNNIPEPQPEENEVDSTTSAPTQEPTETTVAQFECFPGFISCDNTRCIEEAQRCDGIQQCYDGTDEAGCPDDSCGVDDFTCADGNCIESSRKCDGVFDCTGHEDERDCECQPDQFRCASDGRCIEERRRCDGENHCADGSDEIGCACGPDQWQCDHGSCIKRKYRCDGRVDCPTDRSDERNCIATGYFKCKSGHRIPAYLRCNRQYDCPVGDYSDERNCPCGASDFKCDNGHCIPASKHCDRTHDCQDRSDERDCTYGTVCMAYEYECKSGMCVKADARCNGTSECNDESDEAGCPCKRDQFRCRDGSCINIAFRCNGYDDCSNGEDEYNCKSVCEPDEVACPDGLCAVRCNGERECAAGEDEEDCDITSPEEGCNHQCDGICLPNDKICDQNQDCSDGSDEAYCNNCFRATDFRCNDGECIDHLLKCNGIDECTDGEDEKFCNSTMETNNQPCGPGKFQCLTSLECLYDHLKCDGQPDCNDNSDEINCPFNECPANSFQCLTTSQCVRAEAQCDGNRDCSDGTDEEGCSPPSTTYRPPTTTRNNRPNEDRVPYPYGETPGRGQDPYGSAGSSGRGQDPYGSTVSPGRDQDPYGSTASPGRDQDPYGSAGSPNRGQDPYGSAGSPGRGQDPYGSAGSPGRGQDPYGSAGSPGRGQDPYGSAGSPGRGQDPYGSAGSPGRGQDPYGSAGSPGRGQDPYGSAGSPGRGQDPYGSAGSPGRGQDPYGSAGSPGRGQDPYGSAGSPGRGQDPYGSGSPPGRGQDPYGSGSSPGRGQDPYGSGGSPGRGQDPYGSAGSPGRGQDPYGAGGSANRGQDLYGAGGSANRGQDPYGAGGSANRGQDPYAAGGSANRGQDPYGAGGSAGRGQDPYGSGGSENRGQDPYGAGGSAGRGQDPYGSGGSAGRGQDPYGSAGSPGRDQDPYGSAASPGRGQDSYNQRGDDNAPSSPGGGNDYRGETNPSGPGACSDHQWRCENGPCIHEALRCNGHIDCPFDISDEFDCPPNTPITLILETSPDEREEIRYGGDVVLQCRDKGPERAEVRWRKANGNIGAKWTDVRGRLEMERVTDVDAGDYICEAVNYLSYPGSQKRVRVIVTPPATTYNPLPWSCQADEATCGNGQCIPKSAVCNNVQDCSDNSDEDNCEHQGFCEPNQFKCNNGKCVLKTWICDSEDDCEDGSDEQNCVAPVNGQCSAVEFTCTTQAQCIPRSFLCDHQTDCMDGSDETGCQKAYVTVPPTPSKVKLNPGDTLTLRCEATGMPVPLISWRLNWGHVPAKCTSTSVNGVGILTCVDMQYIDSGAYSCEAMNNIDTVFAVPDAIVVVERTDPCSTGYFNKAARTQQECIPCFCFGKSKQCRSADLFTFSMPTPLGQGGTRLLGITTTPSGDVSADQPISDQYYYQALYNGATVTRSSIPSASSAHPYLTIPESNNGNQLKSYGGYIKYTISPHTQVNGYDNSAPTIIIKGRNYGYLFHVHRPSSTTNNLNIEARFTPESWSRYPDGSSPADRADIMMVLADIERIFVRADYNGAGVNITDFAMDSADSVNLGYGDASLVEECTCPEGYEGLSCQKCVAGYTRRKTGPYLGDCVAEECPAGTYGNPARGVPCKPCPCPLTNKENRFARTCSLGSDGSVVCDCFTGYEGRHCEICASGYEGNPLLPGNECKPIRTSYCNPIGTDSIRPPDECVCKDNVQGRYCDQCKNETFSLSSDFREGCASCFCSGVTQQCTSSSFRRKTISVQFNTPQIVDQIKVYNSPPARRGSVRYSAPKETSLRAQLQRGDIYVENVQSYPGSNVYYWSMPLSFAGDKVTAYGGNFRYVLKNVPSSGAPGSKSTSADVQLISDNRLIFHYYGNFPVSYGGILNATIPMFEKGWQRPDGNEVTRSQFLMALADVTTILVKATYSSGPQLATPDSASIDIAEPTGYGPIAHQVEQCYCPPGYIGTSCEDCMPGYTRKYMVGMYLGQCDPCDCNGKSTMCDPATGVCQDCADNTDGPRCEDCKPGYTKDSYGNCVGNAQPCSCDPRGSAAPCDASGACYCKQNVEGSSCDTCKPGTYGLDANNRDGCLPCFCSGATTDCHEARHYVRVPIAAPVLGDNYGGFTITDLNAERVLKDNLTPTFGQSELSYVAGFSPNVDLYWSVPVFPGNRVLSYAGTISLRQKFSSDREDRSERGIDAVLDGGNVRIYWTNPNQFSSGEAYSYQIPLNEEAWQYLDTNTTVTHSDFMSVLSNLKRVLIRATVVRNLYETTIADVSMDTALEKFDPVSAAAKGIEICQCPQGYKGTSCESCDPGYYKAQNGNCLKCSCNGHECQLDSYGQVVCNCRPPYTGADCGIIGLIMELHPTIHIVPGDDVYARSVTFTCKYSAPEPLTIKFFHEGREQYPAKLFSESTLESDGWHGQHVWHTTWDTRRQGEIYECHTFTERGFRLGILTTSLPEPGDSSATTQSPLPQPSESTVTITIESPTLEIKDIGTTVTFVCRAESRNNRAPLPISWTKRSGRLPLGRYYDDSYGQLTINNLQVSDSGVYICEANDGVNTAQQSITLKVPGNEMIEPSVEKINQQEKEYYVGDRIVLECVARGNPTPSISWRRTSNKPLPLLAQYYDNILDIEDAQIEDSGEYSCVAQNTIGIAQGIALVNIRRRPQESAEVKLKVSNLQPLVEEGRTITIVCTGTADVPAGSIDWYRQDYTQLLSNVRSENGVLSIENATPENQGVYICYSRQADLPPIPILLTVQIRDPTPDVYNMTFTINGTEVDMIKIPSGGSGAVDCNVVGRPTPFIKWKKAEGSFGPGSSQRGNTLIISNAQQSDEGFYTCQATANDVVVLVSHIYVSIEKRELPVVKIYPEGDQPVQLGGTHELYCSVLAGVPEPDLTWSRSGARALSPSTSLQSKNVLRFENIEVNDEGEYICTARNDAGTATASGVIKVRSPPVITIIHDGIRADYITVGVGEPVNVECRASGIPDPMVSISLNSKEIVPPQPRQANLRIPAADFVHNGYYLCTATSPAGTVSEQFAIILDRGDIGGFGTDEEGSGDGDINPGGNWDTDQSPVYVPKGNPTTTLECNQSGGSYVQWVRSDDIPLPRNAVQSDNKLIITNATLDDSGQYVCNIYDNNGEVTSAAYKTLQVYSPPDITISPKSQTVQIGDSPTVECIANGDEIISITWKPVNRVPSNRVEIRDSMLIFHQIELEDAGEYICTVESRYTSSTDTAKVFVTENTGRARVSHANEQWAHPGSSVHLQCNVTQQNTRTNWTKNSSPLPRTVQRRRDGSLFIRHAQKSDSGRYICEIHDSHGRKISSNYIDLHIKGIECLDTEFRCYDYSACVDEHLLCDGYKNCQDNSDEENCMWRDKRFSDTLKESLIHDDSRDTPREDLVRIEQPTSPFRVGDNVNVQCKTRSRDVRARWLRLGTSEYVNSLEYGDGVTLSIQGVTQADSGRYRCYGRNSRDGRESYDDFELRVDAGPSVPYPYPDDSSTSIAEYTARLGQAVDLPCRYDLEQPVDIEWRREFSAPGTDFHTNQPTLHIDSASEADAGTYVCRVSNARTSVESRAILTVTGVVPKFSKRSYIALPSLSEVYRQLEIEISFNPTDGNGILLYNSQTPNSIGDYVVLRLVDSVPEYIVNSGIEPVSVRGDRPIALNTWHTIRITRIGNKITMVVDNTGPFDNERGTTWDTLEFDPNQSLYIGGVPAYESLPPELTGATGFTGCISMLVIGTKEKNIMLDSHEQYEISDCNSCIPNLCRNNGFCQEALNERGYMCNCASGFSGLNCDLTGDACRPGICGPGKCYYTADSYKCACPVTHTGPNCETKQSIEYPAFTGAGYVALKAPGPSRTLKMSMNIKAANPVTDGIIMYCAESNRGYGGFISLSVHNGRLEFRYDLGKGSQPIILVSNNTLENKWTNVNIARIGAVVSLKIDTWHSYEQTLPQLYSQQDLPACQAIYVAGVDESVVLNKNTGVTGGFNGCIKDFTMRGRTVDIVNETILSANVHECVNYDRGDIPGDENLVQCQCRNGGQCRRESEPTVCTCPSGYTGQFCDYREPSLWNQYSNDPCNPNNCRNGGICRRVPDTYANYTCDCPLGFAGANCQMELKFNESVAFSGNGYLELPSALLSYADLQREPVLIAMAIYTNYDGVLLYQREGPENYGDYILLRIERGIAVLDWDVGSGKSTVQVREVRVNDGKRHMIIAKIEPYGGASLTVDTHTGTGTSAGLNSVVNADSNIFIGGIPEHYNQEQYPGFNGCIEQVELMNSSPGINLGAIAVAGRNVQRCKTTRY